MDEICKNCKYFEESGWIDSGVCLRYPPNSKGELPCVGYNHRCGEFQPIPKKKSWAKVGVIKSGENISEPIKNFP